MTVEVKQRIESIKIELTDGDVICWLDRAIAKLSAKERVTA